MKKRMLFAIMSGVVLIGAAGFSGCSSSDDVINNPDYNPETKSVKTNFVFNVTQPQDRTRQSTAAVGNFSFQGINDMYLFCFDGTPSASGTYKTFDANHKFALDDFGKPTPNYSDNETNTSSKVYTLYIPTGTADFLFYATANDATKAAEPDYYGKLIKNYSGEISNVDDITFNLGRRVEDATAFTAPQTTLLGILNGLVEIEITTPEELKWSETSGTAKNEYKALGKAYDRFINQASDGDVRQGSGVAVRNMVGELFAAVNEVYSNTDNDVAKALSETIIDKISQYFVLNTSGTAPNVVYNWADKYNAAIESVSEYPTSIGLPDGCAVLEFLNGQFSYKNEGSTLSSVSVDYTNVTYPAELAYYCNSTLWQTTVAKEASSYPTTASDWIKNETWTTNGWNEGSVTAATRAVAMKENITYGVSQLKTTVQRNAENTFTDNASKITNGDLANNVFNGTTATSDNAISFTVTGILVGGQPDGAQYEFLPKTTSFSKVVYDSYLNGYEYDNKVGDLPASDIAKTVTNYTLVLDNYTVKEAQDKVYIALEMTADKSFYGLSGYIKAGEKFYLIGELDPNSATLDPIDWDKQISFGSTDTGYGKDRVFIRDAMTTATFTIGTNALQKAYSTIPDLRSTQMLFGLSVDLEWKEGLNFNVIVQ
ncbi:MAG: hypothetical protein J6W43_09610 [Prevotella sp.]|nr:hypothetical protein [Prevotella sp.]